VDTIETLRVLLSTFEALVTNFPPYLLLHNNFLISLYMHFVTQLGYLLTENTAAITGYIQHV